MFANETSADFTQHQFNCSNSNFSLQITNLLGIFEILNCLLNILSVDSLPHLNHFEFPTRQHHPQESILELCTTEARNSVHILL